MHKPRGYISIVAVLILTAVVILVAVSNAARIRSQTQTLIEQGSKAKAKILADSCGEIALNKLGENDRYSGNETVREGTISCTIGPVTKAGSTYMIRASGVSGTSLANIEITVASLDPVNISDWKEIMP